jgi:hypothetical protein
MPADESNSIVVSHVRYLCDLTVKLSGRPKGCEARRTRTLSSARSERKQPTCHGPLQRWLDGVPPTSEARLMTRSSSRRPRPRRASRPLTKLGALACHTDSVRRISDKGGTPARLDTNRRHQSSKSVLAAASPRLLTRCPDAAHCAVELRRRPCRLGTRPGRQLLRRQRLVAYACEAISYGTVGVRVGNL